MSRRLPDLEHLCPDCDSWCEVWDDDGDIWTSCVCGGGYESRASVKRRAERYAAEWLTS